MTLFMYYNWPRSLTLQMVAPLCFFFIKTAINWHNAGHCSCTTTDHVSFPTFAICITRQQMHHWNLWSTMSWFLPLVLVSLWTQSISLLSFAAQTIFSSKTLACGLSLWGSSSSRLHRLFHLSSPEWPSMVLTISIDMIISYNLLVLIIIIFFWCMYMMAN